MNSIPDYLKFPCDFPIKVMGKTSLEFEVKVLSIVRKHAPDLSETAIESRLSQNGIYQSLTITIHATSKDQLDLIYQELSNDKDILMSI